MIFSLLSQSLSGSLSLSIAQFTYEVLPQLLAALLNYVTFFRSVVLFTPKHKTSLDLCVYLVYKLVSLNVNSGKFTDRLAT